MNIIQKLYFLLILGGISGTIGCSDQEYTSPSAHAQKKSKKDKKNRLLKHEDSLGDEVDRRSSEDYNSPSLKTRHKKVSAHIKHPLHTAVKNKDDKQIMELIEKRSLINSVDRRGHTPLHIAAKKNFTDIVGALIFYHANVHVQSKTGKTALQYASKQADSLAVQTALILAGAQGADKEVQEQVTKTLYETQQLFDTKALSYNLIDQEISAHIAIKDIRYIILEYVDPLEALIENSCISTKKK